MATRARLKGPVIDTGDQNLHVLLIDENQEILDLLRELFEDDGYRVLVSRETDELPQLRDLLPEVIVQEILAGGRPEAGWQYLTLTQREPDQATASLVLCTAAASTVREPAVAERLDHLGVRVLCQPFLMTELLDVVAVTLRGYA